MPAGPAMPDTMIVTLYVPAFVKGWGQLTWNGFFAARKISVARPPPSWFDGLMSTTAAYAKVVGVTALPGYTTSPPAFAALVGSTGFTMNVEQGVPTVAEHRGAAPPLVPSKVIAVKPSKKIVRFP